MDQERNQEIGSIAQSLIDPALMREKFCGSMELGRTSGRDEDNKQMKHEFAAAFDSQRVDIAKRAIYGVAVATVGSARGHNLELDRKFLEQLRDCGNSYANGTKVKCDHKSGIMDVVAFLKDFRIDGDVLRADMFFLENDVRADKILEMADKIPDTFGLSVSCHGVDEEIDDKTFARCQELFSVDIVTEPAANPTGMFSRENPLDSFRKALAGKKAAVDADHTFMAQETKPGGDATKSPSTPDVYTAIGELKTMLSAFEGRVAALEAKKPKDDEDCNDTNMNSLTEAVKNLSAKVEALNLTRGHKLEGVSSIPSAESANKQPAKKDFETLVKEQIASGKQKLAAIEFVVANNPETHKEFVASGKRLAL